MHRSLSRQDVMAFDLNVSVDAWTFRIDDRDTAKRAPRGFELGQPEAMTKLGPDSDTTWSLTRLTTRARYRRRHHSRLGHACDGMNKL